MAVETGYKPEYEVKEEESKNNTKTKAKDVNPEIKVEKNITPELADLVDENDQLEIQINQYQDADKNNSKAQEALSALLKQHDENEKRIKEIQESYREAEKKSKEDANEIFKDPSYIAKNIDQDIDILQGKIQEINSQETSGMSNDEKKELIDFYQGIINSRNELKKEYESKIKPSPEVEEIQKSISALEKALEDQNLNEETKNILKEVLAEKQTKLKETQELFAEQKLSPETITKDESISEIAIMAINPKNNENILAQNKRFAFEKDNIEKIFEQVKDPEVRAQRLKEYLIGAIDNSILIRNEAKYGSGFMGKIKKFLNEGWGGALTKTAAGAGLISGGLFSGMGIFSPMIYGAGLRMASEGVTQIVQELNNELNKKSRKNVLEKGRSELEQKVSQKIEELKKNPEMNNEKKYTEAVLEYINKTYAQEVANLVENDTDHIRKAEKTRAITGWVGGIGGILVGMPMDIDLNNVSHFVNWFAKDGTSWLANGAYKKLGEHLWTSGALANLAAFGVGSMGTYLLNRGAEGDEREFKFTVKTTKEQQQELDKALGKTKQEANNITKGMTSTEIAETQNARDEDLKQKENREKTAEKKEPLTFIETIINNIEKMDVNDLAQFTEKSTNPVTRGIAIVELVAKYPNRVDLSAVPEDIIINSINALSEITPEISKDTRKLIEKYIKDAEINLPKVIKSAKLREEVNKQFEQIINQNKTENLQTKTV